MLRIVKKLNNQILMRCAAVIAATILVSWFDIKPYGVLFSTLLVLWVYKTRCAASIKIIPPPELNAKLVNIYDKLLKLRKDRPTLFCGLITSLLGALAIIGHLLSGSSVVIFGLILSGLVSTKYNFKILKIPNKERLSWADLADTEVEEFLPEVNDSNLFVLQRASDQAIISTTNNPEDEEKSDEIPSELLIPDSIPEIDENSDSSEDELIPKLPGESSLQLQRQEEHQQQFQSQEQKMEFKRGYFKKDSSISTSSSSDDESLSKGLNFQEYTIVDGRDTESQKKAVISATTPASSTLPAGAGILPNLVTDLMSTVLNKANDRIAQGALSASHSSRNTSSSGNKDVMDSSDESDFEILNTDDLNHP